MKIFLNCFTMQQLTHLFRSMCGIMNSVRSFCTVSGYSCCWHTRTNSDVDIKIIEEEKVKGEDIEREVKFRCKSTDGAPKKRPLSKRLSNDSVESNDSGKPRSRPPSVPSSIPDAPDVFTNMMLARAAEKEREKKEAKPSLMTAAGGMNTAEMLEIMQMGIEKKNQKLVWARSSKRNRWQ